VDDVFVSGSDIGVDFNVTEDTEIRLAASAAYNPTAQIYYYDRFHPVGTEYDGQFHSDEDLSLPIRNFMPYGEFTEGPRASLGRLPFGWMGGGAVNMVGRWSENLVDNTAYLPAPGPLFSNSQLSSWFPGQTETNLCAVPEPGCPFSIDVMAMGWVEIAKGYPEFTEGQLLAMKYGPGGVEMFRPVWEGPVDIVPFGSSGHEVQLHATVTAEDFTEYETKATFAVKGLSGSWYLTRTWDLTVTKDF
jgi:hypothetical protein